jgi:hypothetical protein
MNIKNLKIGQSLIVAEKTEEQLIADYKKAISKVTDINSFPKLFSDISKEYFTVKVEYELKKLATPVFTKLLAFSTSFCFSREELIFIFYPLINFILQHLYNYSFSFITFNLFLHFFI